MTLICMQGPQVEQNQLHSRVIVLSMMKQKHRMVRWSELLWRVPESRSRVSCTLRSSFCQ